MENVEAALFKKGGLTEALGIYVVRLGSGDAVTALTVGRHHLQHHGLIHAGTCATLADHTAGAAASTRILGHQAVLTAEFKVNLLKPASGDQLWCRAEVLRAGKQLHVVESRVYVGVPDDLAQSTMVAVALVTLAVVDAPRDQGEAAS
tara:strand:+ start:251 stop:694 length:444 start_codon:yes stop_codon:yes gene_type:complete